MKQIKSKLLAIILLLVAFLLSSCLFPEEFKAKVNIDKNGNYTLTYDGILTYVMAKMAEVEQGKLSKKDEQDIKELAKVFREDSNFKKVKYLGHGQFKVLYERKGTLESTVYFLDSDTKILTLKPTKDKKIEIKGMKLNKDDLVQLIALKMKVDGEIELTTNATVLEHNAKSEPHLFGLFGAYEWDIKSLNDPVPYMLLELESSDSIKRKHVSAKTEAETLAKEWVNSHFLIHKGSWYTSYPNGFMAQFKNVRHEVEAGEVTKADKLNGIEWKGSITYTCDVYRDYNARDFNFKKKGWQDWKNCNGGLILNFILVKKAGSWQLQPTDSLFSIKQYADGKIIKPTISAIETLYDKPKSTHVPAKPQYKSSKEVYYNQGLANFKKGKYNRAIEDFNQSIQLNPNFAMAYHYRGTSYYNLKNYKQALKDCDHAIRLNPDFALAYYNRGNTSLYLKKYKKAVESYNQAINLKPNFAKAYYGRGHGYYKLSKKDNACDDWRKACNLGFCNGINWAKEKGHCQ